MSKQTNLEKQFKRQKPKRPNPAASFPQPWAFFEPPLRFLYQRQAPAADVWVCRPCNMTITKLNPAAAEPKYCPRCGGHTAPLAEIEKTIDIQPARPALPAPEE